MNHLKTTHRRAKESSEASPLEYQTRTFGEMMPDVPTVQEQNARLVEQNRTLQKLNHDLMEQRCVTNNLMEMIDRAHELALSRTRSREESERKARQSLEQRLSVFETANASMKSELDHYKQEIKRLQKTGVQE